MTSAFNYGFVSAEVLFATMDMPICGHRGTRINALLNVNRSCQDIIGILIDSSVFDRFWNKAPKLTRPPSECFFENVYMTFQDDWTALNIERLLWTADFPHSDATWRIVCPGMTTAKCIG